LFAKDIHNYDKETIRKMAENIQEKLKITLANAQCFFFGLN
jgi:hypothetical protein